MSIDYGDSFNPVGLCSKDVLVFGVLWVLFKPMKIPLKFRGCVLVPDLHLNRLYVLDCCCTFSLRDAHLNEVIFVQPRFKHEFGRD